VTGNEREYRGRAKGQRKAVIVFEGGTQIVGRKLVKRTIRKTHWGKKRTHDCQGRTRSIKKKDEKKEMGAGGKGDLYPKDGECRVKREGFIESYQPHSGMGGGVCMDTH